MLHWSLAVRALGHVETLVDLSFERVDEILQRDQFKIKAFEHSILTCSAVLFFCKRVNREKISNTTFSLIF